MESTATLMALAGVRPPRAKPKLTVDHLYNYLLNNEGVPNTATGYNVLFSFNP